MKILPEVRLIVDDVQVSFRQIEALIAIDATHSQNKAAGSLGISVPVLHRYIKELEGKLKTALISSTPRGTILTEQGKEIIETHKKMEKRLRARKQPLVACSPLFSHIVLEAVSKVERQGYKIDLLVGDDELSNHFLEMGLVDVVVFDDPIYIYREKESYEKHEIMEIVKDTLIHVHKGKKYIQYTYGAQRIGFSSLDVENQDYEIIGETRDYKYLIKSGHSFFINRSLVKREGLDLKSKTEPKQLMHSILALRVGEYDELDILMRYLGNIHEK